MKKTIISIAFILMLISVLTSYAYASEESVSTPSVSSLSISSYPDRTVYGAFERLDTSGLALRAVFADGSERIIGGSEIRVSYNRDNCFRVGDDSVLLSYGGKSVYLPITVNRISYDLTSLQLVNFTTEYNGSFQSYTGPLSQIVGLDGIPLGITVSGGGTDVGIYDVSVDFATESKDYLTPESRVLSMTVEPRSAHIVWENTSFVFDGRSKSPNAYFIDVKGNKVYLSVSGAATNAGVGYIARATAKDLNYEFINTTVEYEIRKADFDFSKAFWSKDSFTYDGSKKSISISGLPEGVSVIGYSGDIATDAGSYTAVAMLSWDEKNYNPPPTLSHSWEIKKADYDMSSVSFRSESYVYDGRMHYPTLIGTMPVGADGIALEYSFSYGASHVSDGKVSVTVSFHTNSKNYNLPPDRYSSVVITPKGISVDWGESSLSYTGEVINPAAFAEECTVKVTGGAVNTGKYIATVTTENSDYYIINDKLEYTINKAMNYWSVEPSDSICYEGGEIILPGKSRFGEVNITFYLDASAENKIQTPKNCGKYYAVMSVGETDNYTSLKSGIITFEIIKVQPVSFHATITKKTIKAYESLTPNDFYCKVINNDGSVDEIDPSLVEISYENGVSFRKKDLSVRLEYCGFVLTLPIVVEYADYDMSGVKWTNLHQTYDGTAKTPCLEGLPDGVVVKEYVGGEKINAGSYRIGAVLEYDSENYNEPSVPYCDFVIEKRKINTPYLTSVYNGMGQSAMSDSPLYRVLTTHELTDVGRYTVTIELSDPENFVFANGSDSIAYAIFEILPTTLSVSVDDVRLRLFEELSDVEYKITAGTVYGDDILTVTPYREGRRVLIRSDNPNYILDVTSGRIIRLPYPTPKGAIIIVCLFMLLAVCAYAVIYALRNRERIVSGVAMLKCRWHNRGYRAPMPREDEMKDDGDKGIAEYFEKEIESIDTVAFTDPEEEKGDIPIEEASGLAIIDFEIDAERADSLITDSLAKSLINREGEIIYTRGVEKEIINVGVLSKSFLPGERVDVNTLKSKGLISDEVAYIKVLGGGSIDKPLLVFANDFSLSAVKMIALTGGKVTKVVTFKERSKDEKE